MKGKICGEWWSKLFWPHDFEGRMSLGFVSVKGNQPCAIDINHVSSDSQSGNIAPAQWHQRKECDQQAISVQDSRTQSLNLGRRVDQREPEIQQLIRQS